MEKSSGQGLRALTAFNPQIFQPQKRLGQHFLRQKSVLNKIINAADLKKSDLIIEIGPGLGILTKELAKKAGEIIAIEKDPRLIPVLKEKFAKFKNVEIIQGDARKLVSSIEYLVSGMTGSPSNTKYNPLTNSGLRLRGSDSRRLSRVKSRDKIQNTKYKVVANLPYYAATHIIRCLLELPCPPKLMVLMLQKEVGQRICPSTGSGQGAKPKMNLLAISVQFYADAKIIDYVSKNAFWPKPKVDSAIIKITPHQLPKTSGRLFFVMGQNREKKRFFKIVKAGFSQPRKQLLNNLSKGLDLPKEKIKNWLENNGVNPSKRGQDLNLDDWINLARKFPGF